MGRTVIASAANKKCNKCNVEKQINEFYSKNIFTKDGDPYIYYYPTCKKCQLSMKGMWDKANRHKVNVYSRRWAVKNKERAAALNLKRKFNLTVEDYNKMLDNQGSCCKVCGKKQCDSKKKFAVDHCHKTGKLRGLLCCRCNRALGMFADDIILLNKAIKYLEEYETNHN